MAPDSGLRGLERRVRRLEWVNRGLLAGVCAMACLALLGATNERPVSKTTRTQSIELVNAAGELQAQLLSAPEGPELRLLDAEGVARVSLGHGAEGTGLYLRDSEGTTRVGVAQFAHGGGGFALHGEESKGAAVLYLKGGKGTLTLYGPEGAVLHRFPSQP